MEDLDCALRSERSWLVSRRFVYVYPADDSERSVRCETEQHERKERIDNETTAENGSAADEDDTGYVLVSETGDRSSGDEEMASWEVIR